MNKFKSADERRQDWIKIYSEVETERINSKKISTADKVSAYLLFCLIMFFVVSFISHGFQWVSGDGWLFSAARLGYVLVIFSARVEK